jgi:hypothetical protein
VHVFSFAWRVAETDACSCPARLTVQLVFGYAYAAAVAAPASKLTVLLLLRLQVLETQAMFERGTPPTKQTDRYELALQG